MKRTTPKKETCCPVCDSGDIDICIRIPDVPVYCNVLYESRQAAFRAPTGDIELVFCHNCGHLFNAAYDPNSIDYTYKYENSLHYSGRFQDYARSLARHLIELHDLHHKRVIEIACGQGDFLKLLCSLGANRGIGFDPSHVPGRSDTSGDGLTFVQDYYSEIYSGHQADLICCRHALEHIDRPADFLHTVRRAIGDHPTAVFFEVPNALFTLKDLGIWDIIYEHCGYFCANSLTELFRRNGFAVDRVEAEFGEQFLSIHATPGSSDDMARREQMPDLAELVHRFADEYRAKVSNWKQILRRLQDEGQKSVLWGAGSKGVSFVNTLEVREEIGYLIDLNPYKNGRFVPGAGHQVRSPGFLAEYKPDTVIVMNPLYADEISRDLRAMGISAEIMVDKPRYGV